MNGARKSHHVLDRLDSLTKLDNFLDHIESGERGGEGGELVHRAQTRTWSRDKEQLEETEVVHLPSGQLGRS